MLPVKNLFVLYTGGTIGMLQTRRAWPRPAASKRMRDHLQSFGDAPDLRWRFAELQPPLDSANMTQGNWLAMRDAIVAALDAGHDGVLLLHGTDTLAYSAAALSFLLLDLPIPVLLTGSMLPAGAPGSDAGTTWSAPCASSRRATRAAYRSISTMPCCTARESASCAATRSTPSPNCRDRATPSLRRCLRRSATASRAGK